MPVTTLDPRTALVVIDLQKGILNFSSPDVIGPVVQNAGRLAAAFRSHGLPVVLVNVTGTAPGRTEQPRRTLPGTADFAELLPELDQQASDIVVTKTTWGVFASTDLERQLKDRGVTQVVLCGISSSAGVESSARQAYEAGFNVTVALDGLADANPDTHLNSTTRIFPRLGETGSTADILALLDRAGTK